MWSQSIKKSKVFQNSMQKTPFLPFSSFELQVMGPQEVLYSYLVSEMIWGKFRENQTFGTVLTRRVSESKRLLS